MIKLNSVSKVFVFCSVILVASQIVQWNSYFFDAISVHLSSISRMLKSGEFQMPAFFEHVFMFFIYSVFPSLFIFVPFFFLEFIFSGKRKNMSLLVRNLIFKIVGLVVVVVLSLLLSRIDPRRFFEQSFIAVDGSFISQYFGFLTPFIIAFFSLLFYDFAIYVAHYAQHKLPLLWRFHSVHPSIRNIDSLNSYTHPVDFLGQWVLMIVVAVVFDFKYTEIILLTAFKEAHERFLHTNINIDFGFLKPILIDNRHHFLHHSIYKEDYDVNFAAYFTFWDRLFGTYKAPSDSLGLTGVYKLNEPKNVREYLLADMRSDD